MNFPASKFDFLAIGGAAMVVLGSFAPAASVTLYGDVSYWEVAGPEAAIMILGAVAALVCLALRKSLFARISAGIMWVALLWPYLQGLMEPEPDGFFEEATAAVVDTTTSIATDIALNFMDVTWGTIVLALGCLFVTLAAIMEH
ncbi:MAG: hypothetical protein GY747_07775 [Planctomycetes bacterium]|nr:hypothetical protein [Planctomycetota bacterium]MCP4772098.1 hypothetical protein [Planctomycetota bacterium]MCP4862193.1 hypothetical protein [Planctomycetota bacterium]